MTVPDTTERLQEVFRQVFDDPTLEIHETMDAASLPEWDSLQHITLMIATEKAFGVRFNTSEIAALKQPGQNVGSFVALVERKIAR